MQYITDGTLISDSPASLVAYSIDGINWSYFSKNRIVRLADHQTFVKLILMAGTSLFNSATVSPIVNTSRERGDSFLN
jgi:hypothetical protein